MDNFTYFHICDHRIKKNQNDGEITDIDVVAGSQNLIDIVINGAILLEILEVRVLQYNPNDTDIADFYYDNIRREQTYDEEDPADGYYDDQEQFVVDYSKFFSGDSPVSSPLPASYYEPTLHNRIKWLVKPPVRYRVRAKVKYTHKDYDIYPADQCPICAGKGWFIDILNKNGEFEQPVGIVKVAQRVVKDFLTEIGTHPFDTEYGTDVKSETLASASDDEALFNAIRFAISGVEDRYLDDQQDLITGLTEEETLLSLVTENVFRNAQNPTVIFIQLRITTAAETQTFRLGF